MLSYWCRSVLWLSPRSWSTYAENWLQMTRCNVASLKYYYLYNEVPPRVCTAAAVYLVYRLGKEGCTDFYIAV